MCLPCEARAYRGTYTNESSGFGGQSVLGGVSEQSVTASASDSSCVEGGYAVHSSSYEGVQLWILKNSVHIHTLYICMYV